MRALLVSLVLQEIAETGTVVAVVRADNVRMVGSACPGLFPRRPGREKNEGKGVNEVIGRKLPKPSNRTSWSVGISMPDSKFISVPAGSGGHEKNAVRSAVARSNAVASEMEKNEPPCFP